MPGAGIMRFAMSDFEKTSLWRSSLGEEALTVDAQAQARLRDRLNDIRSRVTYLVSLIAKDIPDLTVHDITHLDALWETASLVAGPGYVLNPAEGFVFGAAVLLHDSAMCLAAYPEGLNEVRKLPEWNDAVVYHLRTAGHEVTPAHIASPPSEVARSALTDVLREVHAQRAAELPFVQWPATDGTREMLIQDSDIRSAYGDVIGQIAASHWWPVRELTKLPPRVNAGPGVPGDWHIRPLKLACLLRVADAAHIDHRRAPRFLQSLVRPSGISASHWEFQTHLGKPSIEKSSLVYTGTPFDIENADAWWRCYDMLAMIDTELRAVNALLDQENITPFLATGVKSARSPEGVALTIPTRRWRPVDTELRVSDVPALVKLLGGERLYGNDPAVPIRELIQNAADAIRARRLLANLDGAAGRVIVTLRNDSNGQAWIDVEDDGIGMSTSVLTGALLDFGKSFWESAAMRREFPGLQSKGLKAVGRFGIGFFSVFMLGDEVTVTSRRHDAAATDTRTLDFRKGLRMRPILREPASDEALSVPGTRVSVRLGTPPDSPNGLLYRGKSGDKILLHDLRVLVARHSPAVDVTVQVRVNDKLETAVTANDWLNEQPKELLLRTLSEANDISDREVMLTNLRELTDPITGEHHGRASIFPSSQYWRPGDGVVTVGGFLAAKLQNIVGILRGEPRTVSRDSAMPTVPAGVLRAWASEQAELVAKMNITGRQKLHAAQVVMLLGGVPTDLPIAIRDDDYLTSAQLEEVLRTESQVEVYMGDELEYDEDDDVRPKDFNADLEVSKTLILIPKRDPSILDVGGEKWPQCIPDIYLSGRPRTCESAFHGVLHRAWGGGEEYDEDSRPVGTVHETEIMRNVRLYVRPVPLDDFLDEIGDRERKAEI